MAASSTAAPAALCSALYTCSFFSVSDLLLLRLRLNKSNKRHKKELCEDAGFESVGESIRLMVAEDRVLIFVYFVRIKVIPPSRQM